MQFVTPIRRSPVDGALIIDLPSDVVLPPGTKLAGVIQPGESITLVIELPDLTSQPEG